MSTEKARNSTYIEKARPDCSMTELERAAWAKGQQAFLSAWPPAPDNFGLFTEDEAYQFHGGYEQEARDRIDAIKRIKL